VHTEILSTFHTRVDNRSICHFCILFTPNCPFSFDDHHQNLVHRFRAILLHHSIQRHMDAYAESPSGAKSYSAQLCSTRLLCTLMLGIRHRQRWSASHTKLPYNDGSTLRKRYRKLIGTTGMLVDHCDALRCIAVHCGASSTLNAKIPSTSPILRLIHIGLSPQSTHSMHLSLTNGHHLSTLV